MSKKQQAKEPAVNGINRRVMVKDLVGAITAISAYHLLPTKWNKPIIEQVFLPAHAATSGPSTYFTSSGGSNSWVSVTINTDGSADIIRINRALSRRWQATIASVPGSGSMSNTISSSDASCNNILPAVAVEISTLSATELTMTFYDQNGIPVTFTVPASAIPNEPALTGSCNNHS